MQAIQGKIGTKIGAIALGANLSSAIGPPIVTLGKAVAALKKLYTIQSVSTFYSTPAFPKGSGPDYVNAVVTFFTDKAATDVLAALHDIESHLGRVRQDRWGARAVDLDLLFLGDVVLPDADTQSDWRRLPLDRQIGSTPDQLILPHPRMQDRSFVLVPLAEIAPDWVHPLTGQTVLNMRDALPADEIASVCPVL